MAEGAAHNVEKFVVVQHSPIHGDDNSYILDAVERYPEQLRAVLWFDEEQLELDSIEGMMHTSQRVGGAGFRIHPKPMFSSSSTWLGTPGMKRLWDVANETKQAMCCLVNPGDLAGVEAMSRANPGTPVVIDHMARLGMAPHYGGAPDGGIVDRKEEDALLRLADLPDVTVKVSAFYALGAGRPPHLELVPRIMRLVAAFGADRLMWGSDGPYQVFADAETKERTAAFGTYGSSIELVRDHLHDLSAEDRDQLLRGTAERVFFKNDIF